MSIQFDPADYQRIASQINLRYKRATSTCLDHRKKHQRCPPDCIGRKREKRPKSGILKMTTNLNVSCEEKESIIAGERNMTQETWKNQVSKRNTTVMEDTAIETLISKFHRFKRESKELKPATEESSSSMDLSPTSVRTTSLLDKLPTTRRHSNER